jgi:hypothetical protein
VGRPRPLRLHEVRFEEHIEVDPSRMARMRSDLNWWGNQTPITICVRCGQRYTEDLNRDAAGEPMHESPEDDLEAVCRVCRVESFAGALRADMVHIIDETLGLGETDRRAIKAFIETVFTDPEKILQVQDLDNRVRYLEKQYNTMWTVIVGAIIALLIAVVTLIIVTAF